MDGGGVVLAPEREKEKDKRCIKIGAQEEVNGSDSPHMDAGVPFPTISRPDSNSSTQRLLKLR
jgi:hypothetical protein